MHITRTALIYLVTRATNRVPAGSDTGYFKRSVRTSWVVLDSSYQIVPGTEGFLILTGAFKGLAFPKSKGSKVQGMKVSFRSPRSKG